MKHTPKHPRSHRKHQKFERRRLRAAKLFEKQTKQAEIARQLNVSREAVSQWYKIWQENGLEGLRSKGHPGRKTQLTTSLKKEVEQISLKGPIAAGHATDLWTLDRITAIIKKVSAISYHPGRVWHILKGMGWSCQKPKTRPKERQEKGIRHWRQKAWTRIKKKPEN